MTDVNNNPRYLHCIFADDVRQEASGKQIVVGMYQGGMTVQGKLPVSLPQIHVMASLHIPALESLESLNFTVLLANSVIASVDVPVDAFPPDNQDPGNNKGFIMQAVIGVTPFLVNGSGMMEVQALINGKETLKGNALTIRHTPEAGEPTPE